MVNDNTFIYEYDLSVSRSHIFLAINLLLTSISISHSFSTDINLLS
jgi:hypothetical protein